MAAPSWVWGSYREEVAVRARGGWWRCCLLTPTPRHHRNTKLPDSEAPFDANNGSHLQPKCPLCFLGGFFMVVLPVCIISILSLRTWRHSLDGEAKPRFPTSSSSTGSRSFRQGLSGLFSSRSLRKNKIWFAIPCSTCAGSSALRARETAFCPWSVCE